MSTEAGVRHGRIDDRIRLDRRPKTRARTFQRPAISCVAADDDLPALPRGLNCVLLPHHRPVREGEFPARGQVLDRGHHLHRIPDPALDQARAVPLDRRQHEIWAQASRAVALAYDVPHARHPVGHRCRVDGHIVVPVAAAIVAVVGGPHDLPYGSAVGGLGMIVRGVYIPTAVHLAEVLGWLKKRDAELL